MGRKSPVTASEEQRTQLQALAGSRDRGEADRARAILLTLAGWTSARIAEVFCVREDTVRFLPVTCRVQRRASAQRRSSQARWVAVHSRCATSYPVTRSCI
jgi:hypothetical protein